MTCSKINVSNTAYLIFENIFKNSKSKGDDQIQKKGNTPEF